MLNKLKAYGMAEFGWDRVRRRGLDDVVRKACEEHGVTLEELYSGKRGCTAVAATRADLCVHFRQEMGASLMESARLLGLRDHTSVLYHLRKREGRPLGRKETLTFPKESTL